jgi:hypothetical protein
MTCKSCEERRKAMEQRMRQAYVLLRRKLPATLHPKKEPTHASRNIFWPRQQSPRR